ncbi:MAG TPA: diacylglycerol kinase family protein [Candidatus Limnocylindria bacterium]|jgi:diacylglycerol kinase (ATP)|nr:diacylglycerol kinase family protein [Candidatus Limnocylindria bacterium]
MGEPALLIVNPAAGKRTADDGDLAECVRLLAGAGFDIETRETGNDGPTSADLARAALAEGFPTVIVAGGDGTVAPAAEALLDSKVTLGLLPFGTAMNIAHGLGIPLKPIDAARLIAERRTKQCDVGEVAGKIFFETCGVGLDADAFGAARLAERQRWGAAFRRVRRWATASPHRVEITIDGRATRHEVLQVLIVNSPYYAWALPVVPQADMTDGLLEVAIFPRMGRLDLVRSLVEIWLRGRPGTPPHIRRGKVIAIASSDPVPVHADGQIAGRLPVTVRCRAGASRVYG